MSDSPLLTIYIPCCDRIAYTRGCLDSILSQSLQDFQVVLIDDASDADYGPLLRELSDDRISFVRNERNLGAMRNMFKGIYYPPYAGHISRFGSVEGTETHPPEGRGASPERLLASCPPSTRK